MTTAQLKIWLAQEPEKATETINRGLGLLATHTWALREPRPIAWGMEPNQIPEDNQRASQMTESGSLRVTP